jgi:hypothetical protein
LRIRCWRRSVTSGVTSPETVAITGTVPGAAAGVRPFAPDLWLNAG